MMNALYIQGCRSVTFEPYGYLHKLPALRKKSATRLHNDQTGATSIEYALIASVVSIVIAGVILLLGDQVLALYQQIAAAFGG
jgi:Flp pilus assembly pilin Flp